MKGQERFSFRERLPRQPIRTGEEPVYGHIEIPEIEKKKEKPPAVPPKSEQTEMLLLRGADIPKRDHYTEYLPSEIAILNKDLETCKARGITDDELPDWLRWYKDKKKEYGL